MNLRFFMDFNRGNISDTEALLHIRDVVYLHGDQWVLGIFVAIAMETVATAMETVAIAIETQNSF